MENRRSYSVAETATILGASKGTVVRLIETGKLQAVQPLGQGSRVYVVAESIDRLLSPVAAATEASS